jgi:hypothetical protein
VLIKNTLFHQKRRELKPDNSSKKMPQKLIYPAENKEKGV